MSCHRRRSSRRLGHLRRLPPEGLRGHVSAEPRGGRLPDDVRGVPSADDATWRNTGGRLQPQQRVPARGHARDADVRDLPQEQRLQGHAARLRRLPPRPTTTARRTRITRRPASRHLRGCHRPTDPSFRGAGTTFNHNVGLRARRHARHADLRGLSQEQRLQGHAARLRRLPPGELQPDPEPEPRGRRVPDRRARAVIGRPIRPGAAAAASITTACSPLVGVHATQGCATCHMNNVFKGTPRDCVGCHQPITTRAESEPRVGRVPDDLRDVSQADRPHLVERRRFNHNERVRRWSACTPSQACATCHVNNVYQGTPRDCVGCHQPQYNATREPEPRRGRLPDDVRLVPPGDRSDVDERRRVQPQRRLRARRRARDAGVRHLPREQRLSRARRGRASAAISRTTTPPATRIMPLPASRRRARPVTGRRTRPGPREPSRTRGSRSRRAQRPVRAVPHDAEQLPGLQLHRVPRAVRNGRQAPGQSRLRLRVERLLLVPSERQGGVEQDDENRLRSGRLHLPRHPGDRLGSGVFHRGQQAEAVEPRLLLHQQLQE